MRLDTRLIPPLIAGAAFVTVAALVTREPAGDPGAPAPGPAPAELAGSALAPEAAAGPADPAPAEAAPAAETVAAEAPSPEPAALEDAALEDARSEISRLVALLDARDATLAARDAEIARIDADRDAQAARIAVLEARLAELEATITALEARPAAVAPDAAPDGVSAAAPLATLGFDPAKFLGDDPAPRPADLLARIAFALDPATAGPEADPPGAPDRAAAGAAILPPGPAPRPARAGPLPPAAADPGAAPAAAPDPAAAPLPLAEIHFEVASARLTPGARQRAAEAAALLAALGPATIRLTGHADRTGPPAVNARLSRARAEAVAAMLVEAGIAPDRIEIAALGESPDHLPVPTGRGVSEPLNRAVAIWLPGA